MAPGIWFQFRLWLNGSKSLQVLNCLLSGINEILAEWSSLFSCHRSLVEFRTRKAHRWIVREKDLLIYLSAFVAVVFFYLAAWTVGEADCRTSWHRVTEAGNFNHFLSLFFTEKSIESEEGWKELNYLFITRRTSLPRLWSPPGLPKRIRESTLCWKFLSRRTLRRSWNWAERVW